jgi:TatD DNase family protein
MQFVDTHCHLDQYADPLAVLKRAEAADTVTVAVTEVPSSFQRLALRLGARRGVRVALGMHPLRAGAVSPLELALFTESLDQTDYVGEVGLDGSQAGRGTLRKQMKVFEHLLQQPRIKRKVLTVHSRGAEPETIERLAQTAVTAILHWYSGALKHIDAASDAGLWFSVNPAMLGSRSGQRILAAIPRERVVTETDGPHTKLMGRPSEPNDIPSVITGLARVWNEDVEQARRRVFENMAAIASMARGGQAPVGGQPAA